MKKSIGFGALASVALLAACGNPQQSTDASQTAATTPADMPGMDGPFAKSEMAMDQAMTSAIGVDAGDTWVKKMIAHHEGAIAMSRDVLALDPTPDVASMAQSSIAKQGAEIEKLKGLALSGAGDQASGKLYEGAMARMRDEMMAASGADPSATYLAKMLAHHRGAVAMSDVALSNGAKGPVRAQVEKTRKDQADEAAMVEAMMRGEPMAASTTANKQPVAGAAPKPTSRPSAAKPAATAAKPAGAPTPQPTESAANPPAGHDMSKMKQD